MRQAFHRLLVPTAGKGLYEITDVAVAWVRDQGVGQGLLTLYCRHTSASLLINENAAPEVRGDIVAYFERIAPEDGPYRHRDEGPDDMPAHLRAALTATSLGVPVLDGVPALGRWQGLFLFEHRRDPHCREVVLHLLGE